MPRTRTQKKRGLGPVWAAVPQQNTHTHTHLLLYVQNALIKYITVFVAVANVSEWRLMWVFALVSDFFLGSEHSGSHPHLQPFPCLRCGRTYKWRSSLNSHIQNECGKEPRFQCPYCSYRSKVKSNLLKHIRNFHKTPTSGFLCSKLQS